MTESNTSSRPAIAVVGVSALFPGSLDATGFWKDILAGTDLLTDVPPSHWLVEDYYDPDPSVPDKTYARRGAFLSDVDFDAMGWGVPPSIVPETDTSQLLALIVAQKVLDDAAGGAAAELDRSRISVILGVTSGQELLGAMVSRLQRPVWTKAMREAGLPEDEVVDLCDRIASHYAPWRESTFPGLLGNVVAGRIANRLDLGGTNCVTDAACASTFSALSMAVHELQLGDSDMVISGGVDTMNDIFMFMCFSKTPALSPTGDCRPFSDRADGTMLSEGIGMVALKRLPDAERDGDRIYAVVEGVGSSSDGRAKSVYAPRPEGQGIALRRAYSLAGYGPETVELVEAHGTGTVAGDAAELAGLTTVFNESGREDRQWCALGSVKSQIGHAKAAAGAAGLFKTVMALHHRVLPPTIKVEQPNPDLALESSPFNITTRPRPWVRDSSHPRRASVSSFGFGGSNFHVALSEYVPVANGSSSRASKARRAVRARALGCELVVLTGANGNALAKSARAHAVASTEPGYLEWLAYSSHVGFCSDAAARLALVATDERDLCAKLEKAAATLEAEPDRPFSTPTGTHFGCGARQGGLAFLFPGQGSQYLDMGAGLAVHFGAALRPWDRAADRHWDGATRLHQVVFPHTVFDDEARAEQVHRLTATEWAQPAIGCTSLSMLALLGELGLAADCYGGHSFGEVTALHAAGVLSAEDFLDVARRRGEFMAEAAATPGSMLAVSTSIEEVSRLLEAWGSEVVVANHNGPSQVVLSGPTAAIEAVAEKLATEGISTRALPVATAFHSPVVATASGAFGEFLAGVSFQAPQRPVYSNTSGVAHPHDPTEIRARLGEQLARPVRFVDMVEAMYESGVRTFVEVGPGAVLSGLVRGILQDRPHAAVSLDRQGKDGVRAFLEGLGALAAAGHNLELGALWAEYAPPPDPAERVRPKLTIPLNGSNHGKPYPPPGGAADLPPPNPPRAESSCGPASVSAGQCVQEPPPSPAAAEPQPPSLANAAVSEEPVAPRPVLPPFESATAPATSTAPGWALAYQEAQRQTAEAHTAYMHAMAQSHTAFLDTVERGFQSLGSLMTCESVSMPAASPVSAARLQFAEPEPIPTPAPHTLVVETPMSAPAPATQQLLPEVAAAPPRAPGPDLQALMLEVVADKTGYPTEMLSMEMELEGDLGIDSIKRVEILAAMQDHAPGLPEVDTRVMAKLQTLGQIVEYMNEQLGNVASCPPSDQAEAVVPSTPARATVPASSQPIPSAADLEALMLEVVADKTGYPTEMLSMEMELESDLGIDSIKRVEILSAMQDHAPGLPEVDTRVMAKLQTLGQIVEYMNGEIGAPGSGASSEAPQGVVTPAPEARRVPGSEPPAAPSLAGAASPGETGPLGRFVLEAVERPRLGMARSGIFGQGRVVVTDDGTELPDRLVETLVRRGVQAERAARVPDQGVAGVIFLGGLRQVDSQEEAVAVNREAFTAAQAAARSWDGDEARPPGLFVTVQDTGGDFGTSAIDPTRAWLAGCAGLARTVAQEWPAATVKAIDLERGGREATELAEVLADELLVGGPDLDVGLSADGRRVGLRSTPVEVCRGTPVLGDGDMVVVSGGARGVTAATLVALAAEARLRLVLLGRTKLENEPACCAGIDDDAGLKRVLLGELGAAGENPTPALLRRRVQGILAIREIRATLAAIEAVGSEARYFAVDVTDADAVGQVLAEARTAWGPVAAVVHGAGVIADKRIAEKTPEQFDRVFDTKVEGLRALLGATAPDPLKLLCLFSSVAARCGNQGQADYAMANEILNKVAVAEAARRGGACVVKSLGWGPWAGGMVGPALEAHFVQAGVPLIPLDVGARMLVDEVRTGSSQEVELVLGVEPTPGALAQADTPKSLDLEVVVGQGSHPYLSDHAIQGTPVVPVVMAIEWFGRAARSFAPQLVLSRLRDLKVLRGIPLRDFADGERRLVVRCRQISNGNGATLALELTDPAGLAHYQCTAEVVRDRSDALPLQDGPNQELRLEDWGDRVIYDGQVLFHGPNFQMIRSIDGISEHGIAAELAGIHEAGWSSAGNGESNGNGNGNGSNGHRTVQMWCTDPVAFDGGLQLAVLWCQRVLGGASLPTGIGEIRTWLDEPAHGRIHCTLTGRTAAGQRAVCDLVFRDQGGRVVAELEGVETHLLPSTERVDGRS